MPFTPKFINLSILNSENQGSKLSCYRQNISMMNSQDEIAGFLKLNCCVKSLIAGSLFTNS